MFYIPLLEGTTYYVYSAVEPFMATVHGTGTGKAFSMVAGAGLERNNPCAFADPCVHGMCVDPTDTAPLTCVCDVTVESGDVESVPESVPVLAVAKVSGVERQVRDCRW